MGYSGLDLNPTVESVSYTKYFEKACPIYMVYGLSYEDFWYGDPFKAKYQREYYKLKLQKQDEYMWEQGMYIYEALLQCAPILHPFSKSKKPLPYTEKPHFVMLSEEEEKERKRQEEENERLKAQLWIKTWMRGMKKKFENE